MMRLLRRRPQAGSGVLETERLLLVPITAALVEADMSGHAALAAALGVEVPQDWPPEGWEPHVYLHIAAQLAVQPKTAGWHRYMLLRGETRRLVGAVGAFARGAGEAELGYSVVNSQQRQGLATEAVGAHVRWLLTLAAVHSVSAQTFLSMPQSVKVMERCGLLPAGEGDEAGTVRYRRFC